MTFEQLLFLFQSKHPIIDETVFYFSDDPKEDEHYIGYLPEYDEPYWVGLCDVEGGCEYRTAEELFYAKIFEGKSLQDRWKDVVLCQIGGVSYDEWMEMFGDALEKI